MLPLPAKMFTVSWWLQAAAQFNHSNQPSQEGTAHFSLVVSKERYLRLQFNALICYKKVSTYNMEALWGHAVWDRPGA